jgi:hypothetical protein
MSRSKRTVSGVDVLASPPLTVILGGKRMPGTEDGPCPAWQARGIGAALRRGPPTCGSGPSDLAAAARPAGLPPEGARLAAAPESDSSPTISPLWSWRWCPASRTRTANAATPATTRTAPGSSPCTPRHGMRRGERLTVNQSLSPKRGRERRRTHTMKPDIKARRAAVAFTQSTTVQAHPKRDGDL